MTGTGSNLLTEHNNAWCSCSCSCWCLMLSIMIMLVKYCLMLKHVMLNAHDALYLMLIHISLSCTKMWALVGLKGRREWIGQRGEEVDGRRSSSRFVLGASCPAGKKFTCPAARTGPRRARRKVLSAPPVRGGGGRDGSMSPQICNRKICHQKYPCYGM